MCGECAFTAHALMERQRHFMAPVTCNPPCDGSVDADSSVDNAGCGHNNPDPIDYDKVKPKVERFRTRVTRDAWEGWWCRRQDIKNV